MTAVRGKYSRRARGLHWAMALLVLLAYVLILGRTEFLPQTPARLLMVQGHFWIGLCILVMTFFRIVERRRRPPPAISPPLQGVLRNLATLTHHALYGFLLAQPVLGLMAVLLERGALPVPFLGIGIPSPFTRSSAIAGQLESLHVTLGVWFYYLIALHVVAAVWHFFIRRDDTLQRMV